MSIKKTTSERIDIQREKILQAQNELKRLENLEKATKRKERDRRIYRRGAHLESLLQDTIRLSDARFYTFLEKTTANSFGRKILSELLAKQEDEDSKNMVTGVVPVNKTFITKTVEQPEPDGAGEDEGSIAVGVTGF